MGTLNHNVQRFGLTEVYSPLPATSALVDVVFVHGLNGDPHNTWSTTPSNVFWPADLLPQFVEEQKARILVYGYDADVASLAGSGTTKDKIHNHAERLVADLFANRRIRKATERPIVFVAHSLGGLIVKRALIASYETSGVKTEHLRSIYVSTYGILFLGTPHKGADLASWGSFLEWLSKAVPKKAVDYSPQLIEALKTNSETLQNIDRQFAQLIDSFHLFFFHEAKPTDIKGTLKFIVEEDSAAPTLPDVERAGIQADHSHMCKFENESSPGFDLIVDGIQRYAEDAPGTIGTRWRSEREERKTQRIRKAKEIFPGADNLSVMQTPPSDTTSEFEKTPGNSIPDLRDSKLLRAPDSPTVNPDMPAPPSKPAEPFFFVPAGFKPNRFFVGMDKELIQLGKKLFDKKRRANGTACVVLHGQAGAGKSHLARQYVYTNRKKFPGGIFWVNARLFEELTKEYWQIAQRVVARDAPELRVSGEQMGRSFVDVVKEWFESRQEWLIVLDGVALDKDQDIDRLQKFVPESRNSSLIYVSRAKRLETLERLLRPQAVKVSPLSDEEACKLLLKSIPIHHPRKAQIDSARKLVKQVGGLPLAINAISHRIAYTHEPIEKYTIKSYSDDQKIAGRYNEIMDDLRARNHMEAYSLISVLCFYGPHIPVEMIHLGLKALRREDVEVKSSENGEQPDINTTFGILMRYGLIERNEPDDKGSLSSSRSSVVEPEPIDMLKMHSVVQKFCCDSLNASGLLQNWLKYAIRLFCYSFEEADIRIKSRSELARVSDYREYLVHGERLRAHTLDYEHKSQLLAKLRTELDPTLLLIRQEIRLKEPSSSHESVQQTEFQISVFDRTSSSSSSGFSASGVRTPGHRPLPLVLADENEFGIPLTKPPTDSPRSIGTASPAYEPRIVDHSPRARFPPDYYENDPRASYPMQKGASDSTLRPRTGSSTSDGSPWQLVQPNRKLFRPSYVGRTWERRPAEAEVDRHSATGSMTRPQIEARGDLSGSSNAITSLTSVHHKSPPRSRGSMWSRSSSGRSPIPTQNRPSYAGVLAGRSEQSTTGPHTVPRPPLYAGEGRKSTTASLERGRSRENTIPRMADARPQLSALRPQFIPQSTDISGRPSRLHMVSQYPVPQSPYESPPLQYIINQPTMESSFHPYHASQTENVMPRYSPINVSGPNPIPLSIDENITITSRYPDSATSRTRYRDLLQSPHTDSNPDIPNYQYEPLYLHSPSNMHPNIHPNGNYSQPVTRDHSHQSHDSGSASEPRPIHHTKISPYLNTIVMDTGSPRLRNADGSPARKSPKLGYSQPLSSSLSNPASPDPMARSDSALLSGTGGWAGYPPSQDAVPRYMHLSGARSDNSPTNTTHSPMPRTDSGPGMVVDGRGMVGHVAFGEFEPTSIAEARRRIREYEEMLSRRGAGRAVDTNIGPHSRPIDRRPDLIFEQPRDGSAPGLGIWSEDGLESEMPYPEVNRILSG